VLIGVPVALGASVSALRQAPDRVFAAVALAISGVQALFLLTLAALLLLGL
jgi:hypothetical protein